MKGPSKIALTVLRCDGCEYHLTEPVRGGTIRRCLAPEAIKRYYGGADGKGVYIGMGSDTPDWCPFKEVE